jgi:hypothetical protein
MKITKLLALILAIVLSLGAMTSCDAIYETAADKVLEIADKKLMRTPYKMDIEMAFSSKNSEMNSALSVFDDTEVEILVDGSNVAMTMDIKTEIAREEIGILMEYIIIDSVAYAKARVEAQGLSQTIRQKAEMTDDDIEDFMDENSASYGADHSDFNNKSLKFENGKFIITCTEITKSGADSLKALLEDQLDSSIDVDIDDVEVVFTTNGLQYESMKLSCRYILEIGGTEITINYVAETTYEYGDEYKVKEPKDKDRYVEVDFDDLLSDF